MRNKILISIFIFFVATLALFVFLSLKNKQQSSTIINSPETPPSVPKIDLPTNDFKSTVSVNDYYKAPSSTVIDEKDVAIGTNKNFDILGYNYNNEKTFLIYLKNSDEPLKITRQNAENTFLEKLGITKQQACSLVVSERLANDIKGATTQDYGLSFCPNGKKLPAAN